ncbi:glycosyltransferase [Entomospira culicis]|uniref:Glycosyltransferase family 4 protein n=1 Tax=Entomospira culicis TaxID=2719989 RepID=A0A968GJU4_9SPIO|nr:glycosyltransferase [Entomospira culicis]NIZ19791.1 glycosyltransferase family 4 protein [Entomospira culicis]NIZ70005.1 glycosyltransferase family 4 protein [Entomospira culicis]WDI37110.1 glycosyltransferase [Entomospira culicis]WDI38739.1 glycosyltransferase [Entomospira culicis]
MRIALFTDTYLPQKNGVAVAVNQLKHELVKMGHEVFVYTIHIPNDTNELEEQVVRSRAVMVPKLGAEENLWALPNRMRILHQLKKDKVEIIHTHTELPQGMTGRYCAKAMKIPHIHTVHTMWADYKHYLFRGRLLTERNIAFAYHFFLRKVTAIIAPSQKAQDFLTHIQIKGVRINNGVDASLFFSQTNKEIQQKILSDFGILPEQKVILFVGRIAPEKRARELFALLTNVMQEQDDVVAIFIGDGVDAESLKAEAISLNLTKRMIFAGRVEHAQMVNYYAIAHLYVTISLSEVQPMTLIEALLSGLPIISRQDSAYIGLVVDGVNGSQHATDEAVGEAIISLLRDEAIYARYREGSLALAKDFTAQGNAQKTLALYEQAVAMGRPEVFHKGPLIYDQ